jgi:hypothetical protein
MASPKKSVRITRRTLLQIMPAQPETFAIFADRETGKAWRDLVPAWGLWEERYTYRVEGEPDRESQEAVRVSGPLVLSEALCLEPAIEIANFSGVRIGAFFHTGEESGFDGGIGEEPEGSPFRPLKP